MDFTQELDAYFRGRVAEDLFSGAVLITRDAARLYARAYGYAGRSWRVPNTLDMRFDTASITKLFTAIVTMQLSGGHRAASVTHRKTPYFPFPGATTSAPSGSTRLA
jgi:hypothetical protein